MSSVKNGLLEKITLSANSSSQVDRAFRSEKWKLIPNKFPSIENEGFASSVIDFWHENCKRKFEEKRQNSEKKKPTYTSFYGKKNITLVKNSEKNGLSNQLIFR